MKKPYKLVIVGGGTAGWMTAAAISSLYKKEQVEVTLIESDQIGSVGVGEATLPVIKEFNKLIGIDEQDMMRKTNATFKLGIKFTDWGHLGNSYIHPFGQFGDRSNANDFHQLWSIINSKQPVADISNFSYAVQMAEQGRFELPKNDHTKITSTYDYAYHFDASLYAKYLREKSEKLGVYRVEGMIDEVINCSETGEISSLKLASGQEISANFFIDCSGFKSLLLGEHLQEEFEDWSKWLLCDRAIAMPSEKLATLPSYTLSTAKQAGWQWQIPLQHRTGNGYVYCSQLISDDAAAQSLMASLPSKAIGDPKLLKFKAGRYKESWVKNCLAIGLSSGFLEPLESTSIYLIQKSILSFLQLFPIKNDGLLATEYNRVMDNEYSKIRDFLILHYHQNQRNDSELWRHCQAMDIPDSLIEKMELFEQRGFIDTYKFGIFNLASWISVLHGQGKRQHGLDPFLMSMPITEVEKLMNSLQFSIQQGVQAASSHQQFINQYCAS